MKDFWRALIATSALAMLLIAGCAQTPEDMSAGGGGRAVTLNGAGASFPYPLYSKWFGEYSRAYPSVRINYQSIGSGGGIQQLKAGTVDFGASDAALSDADLAEMPGEVLHLPTVAGAVAVAYNLPDLQGSLHLDGKAIVGIYRGEITRWNDAEIKALNPDLNLSDMPIAPAFRSDGSGTTSIFTNYLAAVSERWARQTGAGKSVAWPAGIGGKGNEGVAGLVKQTPGGIGYVELAYAEQNRLPCAQIQNAAGNFIAPSLESTSAAAAGAAARMQEDVRVLIVNATGEEAYPIAGFTYLLVYKRQQDPTKGKALVELLKWTMEEGQQFAAGLMYAPLPAEVVKINEAAIESIEVPPAAP